MLWCETMFALFGTKWSKIHVGPMWSVVELAQGGTASQRMTSRSTAVVNDILICTCTQLMVSVSIV